MLYPYLSDVVRNRGVCHACHVCTLACHALALVLADWQLSTAEELRLFRKSDAKLLQNSVRDKHL